MARIRTIKPEFWEHEDLSSLPAETHLLAAAILNHADDEGYFKAHPKLVEASCFPLRELSLSIQDMLKQLESIGYLRFFDGVDGKRYGWIVNFEKHQRVNRPTPSKIKELMPGNECSLDAHGGFSEDSRPERNREQGTGNREEEISPDGDSSAEPRSADPSGNRCPHQEIIALYHDLLPMCPQVREWNDTRKRYLQSRWREAKERQSLSWWREFFEGVAQSEFLTGRAQAQPGRPPFCADLEWLIKPNNFAKVREGKYHQNATVQQSKPWHETASGIDAKAKELGIAQAVGEPWPLFRDRVLQAAKGSA